MNNGHFRRPAFHFVTGLLFCCVFNAVTENGSLQKRRRRIYGTHFIVETHIVSSQGKMKNLQQRRRRLEHEKRYVTNAVTYLQSIIKKWKN